jgi:hypothetical protein
MFKKGFLTKAQVEVEEARLKAAEIAAAPAPEKTAPAAVKWEYKIQTRAAIEELGDSDFEAGLNKLGDDGWELFVTPTGGTGSASTRSKTAEYYFKRAKGTPVKVGAKADAPQADAKDDEWLSLRLKYVGAVDFAKTADALFGGKAGDAARLVADPATNSVLIRGTSKQMAAVRGLAVTLDVPEDSGTMDKPERVYIVALKSAKSVDVVTVIQELYGKDAKGFRITSDPRTNVVLMYGSPRQLEELKILIEKLDLSVEKGGDKKNP